MVYSFELIKHANIRYRDCLSVLSRCELFAMLSSLGISCEIREETMGASRFLTFECRPLSGAELTFLSGHSAVVFMAEKHDEMLKPLPVLTDGYLPDDLPEVLKYKGKTSASFTRMMINTAASLSAFHGQEQPLTFLDPLCGKATGCFCAVTAGMNAVGLDINKKEIDEAAAYFSRYLKFHKLKHTERSVSVTAKGHSIPVSEFTFADTKEHYHAGSTRQLRLACSDTSDAPYLVRKSRAHIIAADLPYGVQHAPRAGGKMDSLQGFLERGLPFWKKCLEPGGVIALSFNTFTLPSTAVCSALENAGFTLPENDLFYGLKHEVEQAVMRDVIFAFNTQEESVK